MRLGCDQCKAPESTHDNNLGTFRKHHSKVLDVSQCLPHVSRCVTEAPDMPEEVRKFVVYFQLSG
jgi:hypothetical protein